MKIANVLKCKEGQKVSFSGILISAWERDFREGNRQEIWIGEKELGRQGYIAYEYRIDENNPEIDVSKWADDVHADIWWQVTVRNAVVHTYADWHNREQIIVYGGVIKIEKGGKTGESKRKSDYPNVRKNLERGKH